jgi:hypothetical protein
LPPETFDNPLQSRKFKVLLSDQYLGTGIKIPFNGIPCVWLVGRGSLETDLQDAKNVGFLAPSATIDVTSDQIIRVSQKRAYL